jgi:hypothetical protein
VVPRTHKINTKGIKSIDVYFDNNNNTKQYLCNGVEEQKKNPYYKIPGHVAKSNCSLHLQQNV